MLLVVSPLGFSENDEENQMAMGLVATKIEHYRMQGKGVPRYEQHIHLMQEQLDAFTSHNEIVQRFGRDPRRNNVLERENTPKEQSFLAEAGFETWPVTEKTFTTTEG